MELNGIVLDYEEIISTVDVVYVVWLIYNAECCCVTGAGTCCAKVFTSVVLDGYLAVLLPKTPDAVCAEHLVAETQFVNVAVDVNYLAAAVGLC